MILFGTLLLPRVVLALSGAVLMACATEKAPEAERARDSLVARPVAVVASAATKPRRVLVGGIDLTGIGYDRGSSSAPVVMIDLSDFACPYCAEFSKETYPAIEKEYVKTGKLFFKYVPFLVGSFPHSDEATRATECAADQGGFWPMMNLVYQGQREWRKGGDPYPLLSRMASTAGLDTARFGVCFSSKETDARTARATKAASELGVRVTPSFLVNGRPIQGALPLADFRKVIDAALMVSRANK